MFLLDGSDFGIDPMTSSIKLKGEPGDRVLEIHVSGDERTYDELRSAEGSQWSGTDSTMEVVGDVHPWGDRTIPLHIVWQIKTD